jgi:hypothetical protein
MAIIVTLLRPNCENKFVDERLDGSGEMVTCTVERTRGQRRETMRRPDDQQERQG